LFTRRQADGTIIVADAAIAPTRLADLLAASPQPPPAAGVALPWRPSFCLWAPLHPGCAIPACMEGID
uniref:ABC transporter ATP-binding protein n=1 Tax=Macrostomum lignano TaxID=282301 RepID=A0A1I8F7V2_9PLAT